MALSGHSIERKREYMSSQKPTFKQILISTLGAAYGVQSSKTYDRDQSQSSIVPYLIAGLIFTTLFVGGLAAIVTIVLKSAGM